MIAGIEVPLPAAGKFVSISRQEHIALKSAANYWQTLHRKAVDRFQWRELRYQRILRELKATTTNAALQAELELARAQIRDLQKRINAFLPWLMDAKRLTNMSACRLQEG